MTRPKKTEVQEDAGAGPGHNKPELTEDEQRVLLYQHKTSYTKAKKAVDDAKAELLRVCKVAKTECGKSAVADIKELILLEQPKAGEALQADIERKLRLARWANVPQGFQATMFEPDRRPQGDVARELGKTAGLAGDPMKPPYDPSVPQYQAWLEGWHDGQSIAQSDFRDKLKANAEADADADQMDLAERGDLPPAGSPNTADVSAPPFNMPDTPTAPVN